MARGTWGGSGDPSIFRVNLLFLKGTSKCQTSFKVRDAVTQDQDAQEVANAVRPLVRSAMKGLLNPGDSFTGVDVLKLGTDEGGWSPETDGAGVLATSSTTTVPDFMAANLSLKSEIRKRYGQGRMFLPLSSEAFIDGNVINNAGQSAINAFVTVMTDNFTGSEVTHDLILVNAHPIIPQLGAGGSGSGHPEIPASWYDVTSLRLNTLVTMLRSRKAGVGS